MLAVDLGMLGADFEVLGASELRTPLLTLGQRYLRAAGSASPNRRNLR